ncbi:MAG: PDZ domain-containing protein, partial [Elusimicrobia bacterium]|nr:PDZ domain-containing protein [Elusimicrobiota bacterium]
VNPGNSGGPLFDMQGEVVGVNSMIITESGGFDGISYAITSNDVKAALDLYARIGTIAPAWLGVVFDASGSGSDFGLRVDAVRPGSPAAAAGVRAGDVIIGLEGRPLAADAQGAFKALTLDLRAKVPGDALQLQVYRGGAVVDLSAKLTAPHLAPTGAFGATLAVLHGLGLF